MTAELKWQRLLGGGQSWFYLMDDTGRILSAKHEDYMKPNHLAEFASFVKGSPCWNCGRKAFGAFPAHQIHHMAGRCRANEHHRTNLFWTCARCHEFMNAKNLPSQLVIKQQRDPEGWDAEVMAGLLEGFRGKLASWYLSEAESIGKEASQRTYQGGRRVNPTTSVRCRDGSK